MNRAQITGIASFSLFCILILVSLTLAAGEARLKLVYSDEEAGISWYMDTKILLRTQKGTMKIWVREIYPESTYETLQEIDCPQYLHRYIGCTVYTTDRSPEGPCYTEAIYKEWMDIELKSAEEFLHDAICGTQAET